MGIKKLLRSLPDSPNFEQRNCYLRSLDFLGIQHYTQLSAGDTMRVLIANTHEVNPLMLDENIPVVVLFLNPTIHDGYNKDIKYLEFICPLQGSRDCKKTYDLKIVDQYTDSDIKTVGDVQQRMIESYGYTLDIEFRAPLTEQ